MPEIAEGVGGESHPERSNAIHRDRKIGIQSLHCSPALLSQFTRRGKHLGTAAQQEDAQTAEPAAEDAVPRSSYEVRESAGKKPKRAASSWARCSALLPSSRQLR